MHDIVQRAILARLGRIEAILHCILEKENIEMADLTKLTEDVTAQTTLVASVQTMLAGLQQQITDLKSQVSQDPATQAAIDALAQQVEANNAALSSAVPANTPAATAPADGATTQAPPTS
jgi:uncharacterized protein involved in exopolysaccharide biosynthesis